MKSLPKTLVMTLDALMNKHGEVVPTVADFLLGVMRDEMTVVVATNKTAYGAHQTLAVLDQRFAELGAPNARGLLLVVCNVEILGMRTVLSPAMEYAHTRMYHDVVVVGTHYVRDLAAADLPGCRLVLYANDATTQQVIQYIDRHPRGFVASTLEDVYTFIQTPL